MRCFYLQKKTHVHVAKPDSEQKLGAKNTKCQECNHEKEKCDACVVVQYHKSDACIVFFQF
ncbi:MAG: hypothetical protein ACRBBZ_06205 [Nitrosopumilus sp.]